MFHSVDSHLAVVHGANHSSFYPFFHILDVLVKRICMFLQFFSVKMKIDLRQVVDFTGLLQVVHKLQYSSLLLLLSRSVKIRLVTAWYFCRLCWNNLQQTCYHQAGASDANASLLGTLRFTERQRDGNVLRQRVNWKEMNNYSCKQFIWIMDTRFSCCLDRQITYFHVLYTTPT